MSIEENTVEQIAVNPDQTAQVVKNEDKFENTAQLNVAVFDPNVVTTKTNKSLDDLADWKTFLHDPWSAMESGEERFEKFKPLADLSRDPVWYSLAQKYGRDIADKTETLLEYKNPTNAISRTINAYNYSRDNLRLSAARKDLSDAVMAGNTQKAKEIENEIAQIKYRLANVDAPFKSEGLNSLMDVASSAARNMPEVIAINLGAAATAIPTAGLSVPAGRVASAAVVYNDTFNLEFGGTLHEIMTANPSMPEAQARDIARKTANRNALIEAAPMLIPGLDYLAGTGKRVAGAVLNKGTREGFKLLALRNPGAAKKILSETAKLLGGVGLETVSESLTEMIQDIGSESAVKAAVTGRDVTELTEERMMSFIKDPFSEENAELWDTFGYTAEGVLGFEAITRALIGVGGHVAGRVRTARGRPATTEEKAMGATANATLAERLFKHRQDSNVAKESPETIDKANQAMVDRGVVPEKIYLDKEMVEQLLSDNNVQQAVRELELQQAYDESQNNGGVIEVDFTKYDSVVNTDEALYQRIKNAVSFSPETLSLNQFQAYIDSLDAKGVNELEQARKNADSFYNRVYNMMMQLHNDEKLAQAQATQAQLMANRVGAFRVGQPTSPEDIASRLDIRMVGQMSGVRTDVGAGEPSADSIRNLPAGAPVNYTQGGRKFRATNSGMSIDIEMLDENDVPLSIISVNKSNNGVSGIRVYDEANKGKHYASGVLYEAERVFGDLIAHPDETQEAKNFWTNVGYQENKDTGYWERPKNKAAEPAPENQTWIDPDDVMSEITVYDVIQTFLQDKTPWSPLIDPVKYRRALEEFVKNGVLLRTNTRDVEEWFEIIARNTRILTITTDLAGHSQFYPFEEVKDYFFGDDEQAYQAFLEKYNMTEGFDEYKIGTKILEVNGFFDKMVLPDGSDAISDYGLTPIYNIIQEYKEGMSAEQVLVLINRVLDQYHMRGDLASAFIEGGAKTATAISEGTGFDKVLHQFVGENANLEKEAPELAKRLARAKEMEAEGKSDEEIFNETHVHVGADGRLRVQISDKDAKIKNIKRRKDGRMPAVSLDKGMTLGDILDHPLLFALYPRLKNIPVQFKGNSSYLSQDPITGEIKFINFRTSEGEKSFIHSVLHETQHAIQNIESWARGGQQKGRQASGGKVYERWKLLEEISPMLKKAGVGGYWNVTTGGRFDFIEPDESRALQDSPAVKELEAKDKDFAAKIARLRELNSELEQTDSSDSRVRYMRLFAEAEARLTEKLAGKSQEELDALDPYGYFDVTEFVVRDRAGTYLGTRKAPANKQTIGEFTITVSPEATEAIVGGKNEGGVIAGSFFREGDKFVIQLSADANPTTFTHELFHWFSTEMQDAYNSGQMTDYWKGKAETLAKMVDAKLEVDPVDPTVTRLNLTTTQEERAADMFLEYLREGKVDNEAVKPLFAYIQTLFKSVFKLLGLRELKLNKESEELFGAIFNAQEVIEDEQRLAGILAIEKPEGADQGLYDMYVGEMLNSRVRGTQELYKKWIVIDKFRKSNEYEKIYNETRLEVAGELNNELRYIVVDEAAQHANDAQATWFALQTNPETADLELSVQQVQDIISETPDKTSEIDRIAEGRMNEYIQQRFKITPEEMGLKASRNSSKVKALLAESLMRSGGTLADFDGAYSDVLATADNQVAKSSLRRLADKEYWNTLESRAVERYAVALANKDDKVASESRRDQAIINAIRMRAEAITNKARRFQEAAEAFRGAQKKITVKGKDGQKSHTEYKYGAYDYDLLQSVLERFGFDINYARRSPKPVAEKMDNWITEQEATTITRAGELRNFISFIDTGHDGTFTSMTGADFEKLDSVFNAVKSVAGARYAIVLENERVLLSQMVADTSQKFKDMGISAFDKKDNYWVKHFGTLSTWTNPEPVVRALFPRAALDNVWLPFLDAATKAERFGKQWVDRYRSAKAKVDLSNKSREYSTGNRLSNKQVADLLLAMGNEHAYENFRLAYGLDEAQAETIVSEALTEQPALADFAKEVWATYGDATSVLDKEFQERTNTLFVEKSHREFEINGIKFGGGYVPVRKQLDYVPTDVRSGNQGGMVHDKKFEKLVVAEADGNIRSIVDITENELFQSAKQGYTAVEYNNARKLLLADGMRQTIGERAFSFLDGWLTSYMMPKYDTTAWVRPLASLSSMGALGFRASTAFLQLSGLVPAAIAVGPRYFARGLHMSMKNGEWAPVMTTRKAAKKSDYMAVRVGDPRSSLMGQSIIDAVRAQDANTQLGKTAQFLFSKVGNAAMWGIQQIDTMVANVTWNGAYLKALDSGASEIEARREADSVVRTVQSDSMQISRSEALQSQYARMFTAFATWIMAMQSQLRADVATRQFAHAAAWAAAYMFLSPIFESFLKEATRIGGSDDDEDYIDRVLKTCYNEISSTVGSTIIPPASIGGAALTAILSGIEEGVTGERQYFDARESNVPALQTAYRGINAVRYGIVGILSGDEEKLGKAATYGASTVSTEVGRLVKYLLAE